MVHNVVLYWTIFATWLSIVRNSAKIAVKLLVSFFGNNVELGDGLEETTPERKGAF